MTTAERNRQKQLLHAFCYGTLGAPHMTTDNLTATAPRTPLADRLTPGYTVTFPGLRAEYSYNPYVTDQTLHRYVVTGLNTYRDPETRRIWAPNVTAAHLIARQHLTNTVVTSPPERTVDPPGLD